MRWSGTAPAPGVFSGLVTSCFLSLCQPEYRETIRDNNWGRCLRLVPGSLERLVVDVYGATSDFEVRSFPLPGEFSGMRAGVSKEKPRFVFGPSGHAPGHAVAGHGESEAIRWQSGRSKEKWRISSVGSSCAVNRCV